MRRDGQADGGPSGPSGVQAHSAPEATRPFTATKGQGNPDLDVQNMDTDQYVHSLTTLIAQALGPLASWQPGEFREHRAAKHIEWISKNCPDHWPDTARRRLRKSAEILEPSVDGDQLVVDFFRETPAHP